MSVRSTFAPSMSSAPLQVMPHLTPREVDSIIAAIGFGDWVGILSQEGPTGIACGEVVAVATPTIAERLARRDDETITELREELARALKELKSLRDIVGEVFAESEPSDHRWKLDDAIYDIERQVGYASDSAEAL